MIVVFVILMVAVGGLMIYEIYSLVRAIIKARKNKKNKKHKPTDGNTVKKGEE